MKTCFIGYQSTCPSLPVVFLLLVLLFLQAMPRSAAETNSSSSDGSYGELDRRNLDPSIGVVIVVLVCLFFMTGCIATYIGGCASSRAVSAVVVPSYGRYLLPVVSASQHGYRRAVYGLDRSEIESLPIFVYADVKKLNVGKRTLECAVCLAGFDDDETLRLLPRCEHTFHPECIDPWLAVRSTCPVCRSNLVPIVAEIRAGTNELTVSSRRSEVEPECSNAAEIPSGGEEAVAEPNPPSKFVRSNSTGHSLIVSAEVESSDRFRLRLPEELRRAKSFGTLPRALSSKKGYRSGVEGSISPSPRLLRWTGVVKSGDGDVAGTSNSDAVMVAIVVN